MMKLWLEFFLPHFPQSFEKSPFAECVCVGREVGLGCISHTAVIFPAQCLLDLRKLGGNQAFF